MHRTDLILRQLDALPGLPAAAGRALKHCGRADVKAREVNNALEKSPSVLRTVKRLLQIPHGNRQRCGADRLTVAIAAGGAARALPSAAGDDVSKELWTHSTAVACAAELLAVRLAGNGSSRRCCKRSGAKARAAAFLDPLEAFACGLLHDIGKIALHAALPRSYARVIKTANELRSDITEVERQVLGIDHHAAGAHLADRWKLPQKLRHVIALHNQRPAIFELLTSAGEHTGMIMLVSLADSLARNARFGYSGNHSFGVPLELLTKPLGLRLDDLEVVQGRLVEHTSERARLLGLDRPAAELYRTALRNAADEIAHMQRRANADAHSAHQLGRSLEVLGAFAAEVHPEASVADVLGSIARKMAEVLNCGPLVAYALSGGRLAQVIISHSEEIEHRRVALAHVKRACQPQGTLEPAGPDLEWLAQSCSPRMHGAHRWHVPLVSEAQVIGGVYFGGCADERARLAPQLEALKALGSGCALALRIALIREEAARTAAELGETNRRLAMAQDQIAQDRAVLCVAELAAGAAHEMNNPLMVISGRSQLLAQRLTDERDRQNALAIHQNAQRLSDMITSLMRYARPSAADPQPMDVQELFARVTSLVAELPERRGRDIQWIAPLLPPASADVVQIARALAALLENALQATEPGGRVEVAAGLDAAHENIVITVFDNGAGMDATTLSRAFDPFFSAKPAGRRRGMGLAVALRLIEANDGSLRLDSRSGAGTRAVITLPVARPKGNIQEQPIRKSA